ncbi:synaptotagmin-3-like [Impatiens glandulifera]|uniref:synaptotagmin-3-like n=1 Tax=Impatiens glandulifera TaxID=253017 RepID=UPI001FB1870F|nr:synaptotagmin-3-like [Impatiens glandulifera]
MTMCFLINNALSLIGFAIGLFIGFLVGFAGLLCSKTRDVKDPVVRPLQEFDSSSLLDIFLEIPLWVKSPDYERVDWLNKIVSDMWPFLDKAICTEIRRNVEPMFDEYIGKYLIKSIYFDSLTLGTFPPAVHGLKVVESNEKELIFEPTVRWAGNPNITVVLQFWFLAVRLQLVDLQIFMQPRITLKPLVPTFPCFANISVSLLNKPDIDFGLKVLGADIMAIPGLYQFVQEMVTRQVASMYLWPWTLEVPVLDSSLGTTKKPMGMLHVKIIRANRLLRKDILGSSDPYVQLSLSGERLLSRKSSIKKNNLNPEWNEDFKLVVEDPHSQDLHLNVYDWEKIGTHDKLGMQVIALKSLDPNERKEFTLDLQKTMNPNDPHNKKQRGQITVELTLMPFKKDDHTRKDESFGNDIDEQKQISGMGLLLLTVIGAKEVEGNHHKNPYALVLFRGEERKTKSIKKTRNPNWNQEFEFMLEEAPLKEKMRIEVLSKRGGISFRSKISLGHVDVDLEDVVRNGHINHKYHLINSSNGIIHLDIQWRVI